MCRRSKAAVSSSGYVGNPGDAESLNVGPLLCNSLAPYGQEMLYVTITHPLSPSAWKRHKVHPRTFPR